MKLTPLDVRKQTFRKTMRGFDPEDVRVFLDLVADEYEQLLQQNGMLSEKVRNLSEQIERYHRMEKTLQNSLLTAERMSEDARERSRLEAETVIEDARLRAERILEDSRERLRMLRGEIQELHRQKELFVQRFRAVLEGQVQFLESQQPELESIDGLDARALGLEQQAAQPARVRGRELQAEGAPGPEPEDVPAEESVLMEEPLSTGEADPAREVVFSGEPLGAAPALREVGEPAREPDGDPASEKEIAEPVRLRQTAVPGFFRRAPREMPAQGQSFGFFASSGERSRSFFDPNSKEGTQR